MARDRDKGLVTVVVLSVILNGLGLSWGLPPVGYFAWDVDGIAPLQPLIAAKRMFVDDWWNSGYYNKYPMGHFFILMAAYAPYMGFLRLSGGFRNPSEDYPFGFTDPETALTTLSLIARSVSALMGVGIVLLVYLTARRLAGRTAAFFAALIVAVSPPFIFYAHTGNVDTPSLFWSALALFAFGRLVAGRHEMRNYVLLGAAVAMAAATKEQTVGLFLLMPLSVVIVHVQQRDPASRRASAVLRAVRDPRLLVGLLACVATFVIATHLVFNWDGNMLRLRWRLFGIHPIYGTSHPGVIAGPVGPVRGVADIVKHTAQAMNPGLFAAAVAGLVVLCVRRTWARHLALALAAYVALAVSMMHFIAARFVMEVILVLAFFAGPVLAYLWTLGRRRSGALVTVVVLICAYSLAYGAEIDYLLVRDARYAAEAWLDTQATRGATVEAFSAPTYLPRFPRTMRVEHHEDLASAELERIQERAPDFVVLSSAYSRRFTDGEDEALLAGLLRGDFGYRPVRVFRTDPLLAPRLIPALSPEIVVLANNQ